MGLDSAKPLIEKLGIKPHDSILLVNPPADYFDFVGQLPDGIIVDPKKTPVNIIHFFVNETSELRRLKSLQKEIVPRGMIWVSWPKGMKEITENDIRDAALEIGLVDIKVCSVSEKWSGLKLVIRLKK